MRMELGCADGIGCAGGTGMLATPLIPILNSSEGTRNHFPNPRPVATSESGGGGFGPNLKPHNFLLTAFLGFL